MKKLQVFALIACGLGFGVGCVVDPTEAVELTDEQAEQADLADRAKLDELASNADATDGLAAAACGFSTSGTGTSRWRNCTNGYQLVRVDVRFGPDVNRCIRPNSEAVVAVAWSARGARVIGGC